MCFLGIEPMTFALLMQCSTTEPQEHSQFNIDFKVRGTEIIDAHLYLVYSYHTTRHQFHQRNSEIVRWLENATHHAQLHTVHCAASASVYSSAAVPAQRIRWSELDFGTGSALFINAAISGSRYQCSLAASNRHHHASASDWNYSRLQRHTRKEH